MTDITPGTTGIHCYFGQPSSPSGGGRTYTYLVHPKHGDVREGDTCVVKDPRGDYRFVTCIAQVIDLDQSLRKAIAGGYALKYIVCVVRDPTTDEGLEAQSLGEPDVEAGSGYAE